MAENLYTATYGPGSLTGLDKALSLPDPLLSFKWICTYLPFGHALHYVEQIDLPFMNIEGGDKMHVGSSYINYPGTHSISTISLTFYEDHFGSSARYVWEWKKKVKDFNTGIYNLPSVYKQTIKAVLLNSLNEPVITATFLGCWPTDTGNLSLNYTDTSGRVTISQTFSVDNQELFFHKYNSN